MLRLILWSNQNNFCVVADQSRKVFEHHDDDATTTTTKKKDGTRRRRRSSDHRRNRRVEMNRKEDGMFDV